MADDKKKKPDKKTGAMPKRFNILLESPPRVNEETSTFKDTYIPFDSDDDERTKTKKGTGAIPKQRKEEPMPSTSAQVSASTSFDDELLPKPKGVLMATVDNLKQKLAIGPQQDDDIPADSFQRTLARHSQRVLGKLNIAASAKKHLLRNLFTGEIEQYRSINMSPRYSDTTEPTISSDSEMKLALDSPILPSESPPSDPISETLSEPIDFLKPDFLVTNKTPVFKFKAEIEANEDEYKHFTIVKFNHSGPLYEPSLSYLAVICKNRIKIYDVPAKDSKFKIVLDHKEEKNTYVTCDWSYIKTKGKPKTPRLAVGGKYDKGGVVTIFYMKGSNFYKVRPWLLFKEKVKQVVFHVKDIQYLFVATDECISLWNIDERKCIYVIDVPRVNSMDINWTGTYLTTAAGNKVKVWNVDLADAFISNQIHQKSTESEPSPMFNKNNYVELPGYICIQNRHLHLVNSVKWYHNTIISKDMSGLLLFWHLNAVGINSNRYTIVMKIRLSDCAYETNLDSVLCGYISTQRFLAVGGSNNIIHVWDLNSRIFVQIAKYEINVPDCQHPINSITFSKCGNVLVAAATDGTLYCWNHRHSFVYYSY